MPTGDGLLVRLTPAGATIRPEALMALCTASRSYGNGVIEITSRGSIQIRGLTEVSVKRFATAVGEIDMALSDDPPVLCDPLAGLGPEEVLDVAAIAAELRVAIAAAAFAADLGPEDFRRHRWRRSAAPRRCSRPTYGCGRKRGAAA